MTKRVGEKVPAAAARPSETRLAWPTTAGPVVAASTTITHVMGAGQTPDRRERLVSGYARFASTHQPEDEWVLETIDDDFRAHAQPIEIADLIVEIVDRLPNDTPALRYVGAGLLEDLLFDAEPATIQHVADAAERNPNLRSALAVVYPVKYGQAGYEELQDLVRAEIGQLKDTRLKGH